MKEDVIKELLKVIEEMYDCYSDYIDEIKDIDFTIFNVTRLRAIENRIIELLPRNIESLENLDVVVRNHYTNQSSVKKYFVLRRFDYILEYLKEKIEEATTESEILSDEYYDGYKVSNLALEIIQRNLCKNSRFGYLISFSNRNIEEDLINNDMNFSKIKLYDLEDMSMMTSKSFKKCRSFFDEFLSSELKSIFFDIVTISSFSLSDELMYINFELFEESLTLLSPREYFKLKNEIINSPLLPNKLREKFNSIFNDINNNFVFEDESEELLSDEEDAEIENNNCCIDINTFDSLVGLIKLEEIILERYDNLDVTNKESLKNFSNLLNFEKEMVSSIIIDDYDVTILQDVIGSDIDFFLEKNHSNRDKKLIEKRIKNLLPVFYKESVGSIPIDHYDLVISNHMVNSLNNYRNLICDLNNQNLINKYIKVYKDMIYIYPKFLNDISYMNYDFTALFSFNDTDSSSIVGLNDDRSIEYSFDKDEILYNLAVNIIDELKQILLDIDNNNDLIALYEFKICEFNDIINNINTEHLYALEADVESISDSKVKSILMNKFSFNHKY